MSDSKTLSVKPIVHYPRVAQVGKTYLMTINLQQEGFEWQYEEEEYPIYCTVDSGLFSSKPVGEPVIVLHRFGGSYGESRFLLTASHTGGGRIQIILSNKWGAIIKSLKLDDVRIYKASTNSEKQLSIGIDKVPVYISTAETNSQFAKTINYFDELQRTEPKHFTVPHSRNPYFTGREEILTQLHIILERTNIAAIAGLGGVGKTQTAVEYAYRYFADEPVYEWVLWVNASSLTLASSFGALAIDLALPNHRENKLDENIAAVLRWLETTNSWLLIFDNVDDPQAVKPFRPKNPEGRILITSRIQQLDTIGIAAVQEVAKLSRPESIALLLKRTGQQPATETEQAAAEQLAAAFDDLPLALEQAGAYIRARQIRIQDYWTSYQQQHFNLLEQHAAGINYPASVGTTWAINFEAVQSSSEAAADLLRVSAFLAPDNIPYEILALGKDQLGAALSAALAEAAEDELIVPELLEELTLYSLIRLETGDRYSIHRMVQEVLRNVLTLEQRQQWIDRTVAALNETFPSVEFENWMWCDRLVEHVLAIDLQQATGTIELGLLLNQAGYFLTEQGRYSEAEPLFLQALDTRRSQLGQDHPDTASSLNNLAELYRSQGRYSEAEPLFLQALDIRRSQLGQDHPDIATSLNNLAGLYYLQGRYGEVEPLFLQALNIRQSQLGQDHPDTGLSLNNLAELYRSQGRYGEAEPLYLQALDIIRSQLGQNHPDTATSLNNLAELYRSQGRYGEAEPLLLLALDIRRSQLGQDHPDTASSLNNLALLYDSQGRYSEAELLLQQALHINQSQLGREHPDTIGSLNNLANLYYATGRYSEAEPLYLQTVQIRQRQLGQEHPDTIGSLNNLAGLYKVQGRYSEAEPLFQRVLIIFEQQLGANHPSVASSLNNLANLYYSQERFSEAEPLYLRSLAILERLLGKNHPDVGLSLENLAGLYQIQKRYSEAAALYQRSLAIYEQQLGEDHPNVAANLNALGYLYFTLKRYDEANPLYQRSLAIYEKQLGKDHPNVATSLSNLAELYEINQQHGDAEKLYAQSLDIRQRSLGDNHPTTVQTLRRLTRLRNKNVAHQNLILTITASAITNLAFTKFIEGGAGKAAERFTEAAFAKMDELRKQIWAKLRGGPRVEEVKAAIEMTAQVDQAQVNRLTAYLQVAMDEDPQFASQIQALAYEITLMQIEDNSSMTQINYGGTNYQTKTGADNTNFFGGTHYHDQK